jgi:ligand-binding SRPBCC domain-containing protein
MPTIHLTTFVAAPIDRVFDLARSIDLHQKSMSHTGEVAVAGTTMGLINLNESVTWKAKHLMKTRVLKSEITAMQRPHSFTDEMKQGDFKSMRHQHHFKQIENGTLMIDILDFESPYGGLGRMFNSIYLTRYMEKMIETRNLVIKEYAEGNKWQNILNK